MPPDVEPLPPPRPPRRHFRVGWPALAATATSLGGYSLCSYYERSSAVLVGLGLAVAFAGFLGVSLALILDSDPEGGPER
jgi:hypothetical protein